MGVWAILGPVVQRGAPFVVGGALTAAVLAVWSQAAAPPVGPGDTLYPVADVVDGDTITITMDGRTEILRLIGINAPEVVNPREPVQCFGSEARERAKELLHGQQVRLAADPTQEARDQAGRLLVYLWRADGLFINREMVREGYAHEETYDRRYQYQAEFLTAEQEAREQGRGLWSPTTCNGDTMQPAGSVGSGQ